MTVSIQTDALLSQFAVLAYKDKAYLDNTGNLPTGWKLADSEVRGPFAAFAFQNESNGKVIVAYRGTDGLTDAGADLKILSGGWNSQFKQGMDFFATVKNNGDIFSGGYDASRVLVTGHSLGGAIAQIVGHAYGLDGSTIDPGAAGRIVATNEFRDIVIAAGLSPDRLGIAPSFTNHVVVGSTVSNGTGEHVGAVSDMPAIGFTGNQTLLAFLIGMVNPAAAFAYAVGTDQFSNRHSADQVSQALQLMSGAVGNDQLSPDAPTLKAVIDGWDNNGDGESKPRYSQSNFELRNPAGELQGIVRFEGSGTERRFEVLDAAGNLKSSTTLSPSGAVTVQIIGGDRIEVSYTLPAVGAAHSQDPVITTLVQHPEDTRTLTQHDTAGEERLRIETNNEGEVSTRWQGEDGRQLEGNARGIEQKKEGADSTETAGLDFLGYVSFASFTPDNTLSTTRSGPGGAYRNERRNAAGQVIASTVIEADGSSTLSTMAGNASTVRHESADGSVVTRVTDGNGTTRDLTTLNADGSSGYWVYDAQGKLQSSATLAADGGSVTATYHGNGNPKLEITLNPDGARIDHQHSEDGHSGRIDARNADGTLVILVYSQNASDVTTRHPDGRIETKTTANGIVTGEYTRHPDGGEDIYRRVVNADGSVVEEWTWADGARKQLYYHPNGKLASESAFAADRSGYLRQYADSGRLISSAVYNADGSGSETFYPENGDPSTREWNGTPPTELRPWTATTIAPDGTTTLTHHRADGSVERIEIRRPDGSVKITDYHPSGAPVQTVASNFADQFTGSAISDLEHRDSQSPSGDGDGYRFTATPASYVARYAGTGQMIEQTLTYADGSTNAMYYFADGKLAEETRRDLDGASRTLAFHVSGKKALEEEIDVDGSQERVSYFANGHVAEAVKRGADGSPVASESAVYRSNGSLAHQRIQQADGSVVELSQLANGASVKETRSADGAVVRVTDDGKGNERTARFDADGNRAREEWKRPDGTWGFDDYLADGSSRGATVSAQFRSNYQDDGRGNRTEILFDTASDERVGERRLRADGSVTTVWHHAGGVSSGNVALAGGNGLSWLDDGAGKIRNVKLLKLFSQYATFYVVLFL